MNLTNLVTDAQHPKRQRLTSRHPFSRHTSNLIKADFDLLDTWRDSWKK